MKKQIKHEFLLL